MRDRKALLRRIEELEEVNHQLRDVLADPALEPPEAWGLTPQQGYLLRLLVTRARPPAVRDLLMALESNKGADFIGQGADILSANHVYVQMYKIRNKLKNFGWTFPRARSGRYSLGGDKVRAALKSAMRGGAIHAGDYDL